MTKKTSEPTLDLKKIRDDLLTDLSRHGLPEKLIKALLSIAIAVLCGTLLLIGVYLLPASGIDRHVRSSADTIAKEGTYPRLSELCTSQLDNFTDSIMLLEAAYSSGSPLRDAMSVPRGYMEGRDVPETLTAHYIGGEPFDDEIWYARYWHGYLVFLKPLLAVMDYPALRTLNGILQAALVILISALLYRRGHRIAMLSYQLSYAMLMPVALASSLQFSSCFYVFNLACLALLLQKENDLRAKAPKLFLWCGILTAFFDLLTYPAAAFGMPMVFYLLLIGDDAAESKIVSLVRNGISWCLGFGGMWAAKWLLASAITGKNVIAEGMYRVAIRTYIPSEIDPSRYGWLECEIKNYGAFFATPFTAGAILLAGYLICWCLKAKKNSGRSLTLPLLPFALAALIPVAWHAFAVNHSTVHYWFTNKACVVSLTAILFGLACFLDQKRQAS